MSKRKKKLYTNKNTPQVNSLTVSDLQNNGLMYRTHNDTRKLDEVFGYKQTLAPEDYWIRYKRQHIAKRIVEIFPKKAWLHMPEVTDKPEEQEESIFEKEVIELVKRKKLQQYIKRADILSCLGRYSVIYIGIAGTEDPKEPLEDTNLTLDDISFISTYSEENAVIESLDMDKYSESYGNPLIYQLKTGTHSSSDSGSIIMQKPDALMRVHASRIIHIAQGALENEVYGTPYLEDVYDILIDLLKITGGSSETFYLNSRGGLSVNIKEGRMVTSESSLVTSITEYVNEMTRVLVTQGAEINTIEHSVADPTPNFNMLISTIAGAKGIPVRILLGSERGELASTQDKKNFNEAVKERQTDFCENQILRPLIDFFIRVGVLSQPIDDDYSVIWDDLYEVDEKDEAEITLKRSQAIRQFTDGVNSESVVPKQQFVEDILHLEYREDEVKERVESKDTSNSNVGNENNTSAIETIT